MTLAPDPDHHGPLATNGDVMQERCMVKGCPEYGVWKKVVTPLSTAHPHSHYMKNHYRPAVAPAPGKNA